MKWKFFLKEIGSTKFVFLSFAVSFHLIDYSYTFVHYEKASVIFNSFRILFAENQQFYEKENLIFASNNTPIKCIRNGGNNNHAVGVLNYVQNRSEYISFIAPQ